MRVVPVLIFLIAASLRVGLGVVNRDFNDNHMYPVRLIMLTNKLPPGGRGGETYQPKLYHYTVAQAARLFRISPDDKNGLIMAGQAVNLVAAMAVLVILWLFLWQLPLHSDKVRLWTFALAAFNPALVGIGGQATNDMFVIFFSTLAIYCTYLYTRRSQWLWLAIACLSASLAVVSKSNGWTTPIAIWLALLVFAAAQKKGPLPWAVAMAFPLAVALLSFLNPVGQYAYNLQHSGTPVLVNMDQAPPPSLFTPPPPAVPYRSPAGGAIASIQDGFFTFKFLDLLRDPYVMYGSPEGLPESPTSFWTLLYARAHTIHFDLWPPTWRQMDAVTTTLLRLILIAALVPTILLLVGAFRQATALVEGLVRRRLEAQAAADYGLWILTFLGYLGFVVLYTYEYRAITVIKAIFILPGLLALVRLLADGLEQAERWLHRRNPLLRWAMDASLGVLLILYVAETTTLIIHLAHTPSPFA